MEFRILGSLEVAVDGRLLPLGGPSQRALLALLLLHANEIVSSDRLLDELWADEPPASGTESAGDITRHRCERDGACRTQIGLAEPGVGHGLLLRDRLGGIWEAASGANRLEPGPTELKRSL